MSKIIENISNLNFIKVKFILRVNERLQLPVYKGSVFRGMIMRQFKRSFCPLRIPECESCNIKAECIYFALFETELLKTEPYFLKKVKKAPHPFVIEPPETEKTDFIDGEEFGLKLILIGKYSKYLAHFVYSIEELGAEGIPLRGKFKLQNIMALDNNNDWLNIYETRKKNLNKNVPVIRIQELKYDFSSNVRICFKTPTRIQKSGKLTSKLTAEILFETLYRRLLSLNYSFCDGEQKNGHIGKIDAVIKKSNIVWKDWERISNRQRTKMKLGGFVGELVLDNLNQELLQMLIIGSHLHIGKNTAFGLGRYEVIFED